MLYIEPYGGLCNRMRSISSAYSYAKEHNCKLTVIWCELNELNSSFSSILGLEASENIRVINIPYADERIFKRIYYRILKRLLKLKCTKVYDNFEKVNKSENVDNCYIRSCSYWHPSENPFDMFILNSQIEERVNRYLKDNTDLIGVHIRRTDNSVSVDNSPTDAFYPVIDEVLLRYNDSKLYIATDDAKEIEKLTEHYGADKVKFLSDIDRKRNSKKGIIDAVTELYILANCKEIVGSYYSSFTDTAAEIGHIRKNIVKIGEI